MKVAVAIWNDRISPVFDVSRTILILDIAKGAVTGESIARFDDDNPVRKLSTLTQNGIRTLICGAISRPIAEIFINSGIRLIPFVAGNRQEVIDAYLNGSLPCWELCMPGCRFENRFSHQSGKVYNECADGMVSADPSAGKQAKEGKAMPNRDETGPGGRGKGRSSGQGRAGGRGRQTPGERSGEKGGRGQGKGRGRSTGGRDQGGGRGQRGNR
jgi:predicted Fe-Mo cluster-binding NifX family protein